MNLYAYVSNKPITSFDYEGDFAIPLAMAETALGLLIIGGGIYYATGGAQRFAETATDVISDIQRFQPNFPEKKPKKKEKKKQKTKPELR